LKEYSIKLGMTSVKNTQMISQEYTGVATIQRILEIFFTTLICLVKLNFLIES